MQKNDEVNMILVNWLTDVMTDLIVSRMEDEPEKLPVLCDVNTMLNKISNVTFENMDSYLGEELVNKIFAEIKDSI